MVSDNSIPINSVTALTLKQRDAIESALQILQAIKAGDGDYWGKLDETIAALDEELHLQPDPAAQPSREEVLSEWQPIETAPKTGRTLLLGYPNVLGKWRTVRGQWMSEAYIAENWEEPDDAEAGWYETSAEADDVPNCWPITPTHWMPLPTAPEVKP